MTNQPSWGPDAGAVPTAMWAATPPPGWYPDPGAPTRERWWSGTEWTEYSHRAARPGMLGVAYTRSMWAGPNATARRARMCSSAAAIALLLVLVIGLALEVSGTRPGGNIAIGMFTLLLVAFALGILGIVLVGRAVAASRRLGGIGLAVSSLVSSGVAVVWSGAWIVIAIVLVSASVAP